MARPLFLMARLAFACDVSRLILFSFETER